MRTPLKTIARAAIRPLRNPLPIILLIGAIGVQTFTACDGGTAFTDPRDGKKYKTVKIGEQTWMAKNLNYDAEGSKCYDDDPANCQKYGRLYDWKIALSACPEGWHLPSKEEWQTLVDIAGGNETGGAKLKAKSGWNAYEGKSGNGTDEYGFAALPGGYFEGQNEDHLGFNSAGLGGYWWTASSSHISMGSAIVYFRVMSFGGNDVEESSLVEGNDHSVRCVMDGVPDKDEKHNKLIPAGYSLSEEIHGDLNGDKTDDLVLLVTKEDDEKRRGIMVYFKEGDAYKLALENRQCLVSEFSTRPIADIEVKKGNLYVKYTYAGFGGSNDYTFRFRNSVFELIGFDGYYRRDDENGGLVEIITSINFLSKKMKVTVYEEGKANKETWKSITLEKLPGLADIDFDNFTVSNYYKESTP